LAELRVAPLRGGGGDTEGEADRREDVGVDGLGEVVLQQAGGDLGGKGGPGPEGGLDVRREAPAGVAGQ
jgi:hypothetical protein